MVSVLERKGHRVVVICVPFDSFARKAMLPKLKARFDSAFVPWYDRKIKLKNAVSSPLHRGVFGSIEGSRPLLHVTWDPGAFVDGQGLCVEGITRSLP